MSKKTQEIVYIALVPVWSIQHGREFGPGEVIPFDLEAEALNKPNLERLINNGALKAMIRQEYEASQVTDEPGAQPPEPGKVEE